MVELIKQNYLENKNKFEQTKAMLTKKLGNNVPVNHVGSTAIPEIEVGKNIIDVLVGATNKAEFDKLFKLIEDLGFYPSTNSKSDIYQFFASRQGETGNGDTHIHLVIINTERYDEFLTLKTYLLENKDEAINYSNHKKELITLGTTNRKEYRATKSKYVTNLIERAKQYKQQKN